MFEQMFPLTDSRSLADAGRSVFFALRTATGNGHRFVAELYRRGVRRFVVEPGFDTSAMPLARFEVVDSPLEALQAEAARRREAFGGKVVGITGSRGKTMVKEWLCSVLAPDHSVCRSPRSYNSQTGVPLSVWRLSEANDLGVFEAGISRPGEMKALQRIIRPDIAVFTGIGPEHDEGFASRSEKVSEKMILAGGASTVVYPLADKLLSKAVKEIYGSPRLIGWEIVGSSEEGAPAIVRFFDPTIPSVPLPAAITPAWQLENMASVAATMIALGYNSEDAARRIARLRPQGTRLQVTGGVADSLIIRDDYGCDLSSLAIALDIAGRRRTPGQPLTVILSDLDSEPGNCADAYARAGEMLRQRSVSEVYGIGCEISRYFKEMDCPGTTFCGVEEFIESLPAGSFASHLILIKGNPDAGFDRIVNALEAKTHETVLEVNLDAMVDNFNFFRSQLKPETGLVAMVKASGYGAGALEPAKTLQAHGAAYLAVAVGDEGEELRRAGITMPIMVLNPIVLNYKQLFDNRLEPEIFSFESLDEIIASARKAGVKDYPVHIKLDSGMHRLGFRREELPELLARLDAQDAVRPRSVFSHLATADCPDMDDYTLMQLRYYDECSSQIVNHFPYKILRHVLNTAGILRFPQYQYDMCRLGIGLYGIPVLDDGREKALRPISSLKSVIISLRRWEPGETIGYGRRGVLTRPSVIATVPVGYADGFNRHCGRGRWSVVVNGHRCPTVGNICMDICMIDVTDVPDVRIGDRVEIFGPDNPATEMAGVLDTIAYECLTSVAPRVRRVYFRES